MSNSTIKNKHIDLVKIRTMVEGQYRSLSAFGTNVLGLKDREGISARLTNKRKITGDELILIAKALNVSVDDLRLNKSAA